MIRFLREHIKHVIYVVKENRTFDQILGDLATARMPTASLTQFGEALTPNFHRLARQFVTLDNFMDPGDGSMDGWSWSLQGRVTNTETITQQINYAPSIAVCPMRRKDRTGACRSTSRRWPGATRQPDVPAPPITRRLRRRCRAGPRTC